MKYKKSDHIFKCGRCNYKDYNECECSDISVHGDLLYYKELLDKKEEQIEAMGEMLDQ